jgi:hypothetical protein
MTKDKENDIVNNQLKTMWMAAGVSYYPNICPVNNKDKSLLRKTI